MLFSRLFFFFFISIFSLLLYTLEAVASSSSSSLLQSCLRLGNHLPRTDHTYPYTYLFLCLPSLFFRLLSVSLCHFLSGSLESLSLLLTLSLSLSCWPLLSKCDSTPVASFSIRTRRIGRQEKVRINKNKKRQSEMEEKKGKGKKEGGRGAKMQPFPIVWHQLVERGVICPHTPYIYGAIPSHPMPSARSRYLTGAA